MARRLIIIAIAGIALAAACADGLRPASARAGPPATAAGKAQPVVKGEKPTPADPQPPKKGAVADPPDDPSPRTTDLPPLDSSSRAEATVGGAPSDPGAVAEVPSPIDPGELPPISRLANDAPVDDDVHKVRSESPQAAAAGDAAPGGNPFILGADRLAAGPQAVGLTVEVQAPPVVNLNLETTIKIVVRNTGKADAAGVMVRDALPEGLEFLGSQPEPTSNAGVLTWSLGNLAVGGERVVKLRVKPTKARPMDHAATVTMAAGAKARMTVREPKLKVELTALPTKVLKGQQVRFNITVSNPGTGPARSVAIQAKLGPGLRHAEGGYIEQVLDEVKANESIPLDPLFVEAIAGGEQNCEVLVSSPDVAKDVPEARASQTVTVTEPKLTLVLSGHTKRITNTPAAYRLTVENPGTAPAQRVRVTTFLPIGGKVLAPKAPGITFDPSSRRLTWEVPHLDSKEHLDLDFKVVTGGPGLYHINSEAKAAGPLSAKASIDTDVAGMADVRFDVIERTRAIDVKEETTFEIRIKNYGSKDATNLLIFGRLSGHLKVQDASGTEKDPEATATRDEVKFPKIDHLGPGQELNLAIKVIADKPGVGTCQITLVHDDNGDIKLNKEAAVKVMDARP